MTEIPTFAELEAMTHEQRAAVKPLWVAFAALEDIAQAVSPGVMAGRTHAEWREYATKDMSALREWGEIVTSHARERFRPDA